MSAEQHVSAKLTPAQRVEIRDRYADGEKARALAAEFGVSTWTVHTYAGRRLHAVLEPVADRSPGLARPAKPPWDPDPMCEECGGDLAVEGYIYCSGCLHSMGGPA